MWDSYHKKVEVDDFLENAKGKLDLVSLRCTKDMYKGSRSMRSIGNIAESYVQQAPKNTCLRGEWEAKEVL